VNPSSACGVWPFERRVLLDDTIAVGWARRRTAGRAGEPGPGASSASSRTGSATRPRWPSGWPWASSGGGETRRTCPRTPSSRSPGLRHSRTDRLPGWLVRTAFRLALRPLRGEKRRLRAKTRRPSTWRSGGSSKTRVAADAAPGPGRRAVDALPEKLRIVTVAGRDPGARRGRRWPASWSCRRGTVKSGCTWPAGPGGEARDGL